MIRWALALLGSVAVVTAHAWKLVQQSMQWATFDESPFRGALIAYVEGGDLYLGLSYGLAAGFTVLMLADAVTKRRRSVRGAIGGGSLLGVLYVAGCWLVGCCGSPLLPVYLSLFGARALDVTKPLILGLTALSIGLGWIVSRRSDAATCCKEDTANIAAETANS